MSQDPKRQITNRALKVGSKRVWAAIKNHDLAHTVLE